MLLSGDRLISQQPSATATAPTASAQILSAATDHASAFEITGVVINSVTQAPVAGAELNAAPMSARRIGNRGTGRTQGPGVTAVSDSSGHFAVEVPSAGGWSLTASAHGYHTQALDEHEGYSTAIVLTEAAPKLDVTFRLPPASAIEGYVVDEAGEAVRNAQLTLSLIPPATPDDAHPRHRTRGSQRTDDRGYYKFPGLLAGSYEIRLQAQPWYASNGNGQWFGNFGGGITAIGGGISFDGSPANTPAGNLPPAPDPLDVVYPTLWYPGVTDVTAATPIALRAGEVREADFRLSPIPGFHLRIAAGAQNQDGRRPATQSIAYLSQILPDGGETAVAGGVRTDAQGNLEFSGLAPGTYQVHRQGEVAGSAASTIQISPNSARTVDLSEASSGTPVTIKIDPAGDLPSLQITFRNVESGRVSLVQDSGGSDGRGARRRPSGPDARLGARTDQAPDRPADRSIHLAPGRYEVSLSGIDDLHLTGIEATGATAMGRTVTIGGGGAALMLHVAGGRANVTGFVRLHGVPCAGAMMLLVPATFGDPAGLDVPRRDQSNTDGSFDILNVLPGPYILVAIDHGWDANWRDPATLRHFLMHGLALDLAAPVDRKVTVEAQSP